MPIRVLIDTRERMDLPALQAAVKLHQVDLQANVSQLPLADFVFVDTDTDAVLMLVERKSPDDFAASLQPGHMQGKRLDDQLARMKASGVPALGLLLTGNFSGLESHLYKAKVTITSSLQAETPRFSVWELKSASYIPLWLARAIQNLQPHARIGPNITELSVAVRKSKTDTPEKLYHSMMQLVPGLSANSAAVIVAAYPSLSTLQAALRLNGKGAITKLKHNNRAINQSSAALVHAFLTESTEQIK